MKKLYNVNYVSEGKGGVYLVLAVRNKRTNGIALISRLDRVSIKPVTKCRRIFRSKANLLCQLIDFMYIK